MELIAAPFLVLGIVAVLARFGPPMSAVRLPDVVDRSVGMYVVRSLRGTLDREDPVAAASQSAPAAVNLIGAAPSAAATPLLPAPATQPAAATQPAPATPAPSAPRRDLLATPARLAAIGIRRAVPTRRPVARGPITLAPRSVPATRLAAVPPPPLWRRFLGRLRPSRPVIERSARAGSASRTRTAATRQTPGSRPSGKRPPPPRAGRRPSLGALATAVTVSLVALVALAAVVREPARAGGVLAATSGPNASIARPAEAAGGPAATRGSVAPAP